MAFQRLVVFSSSKNSFSSEDDAYRKLKSEGDNLVQKQKLEVHNKNVFQVIKDPRTWDPIIENMNAAYLKLVSFIKLIIPTFNAPVLPKAIERIMQAENKFYSSEKLNEYLSKHVTSP